MMVVVVVVVVVMMMMMQKYCLIKFCVLHLRNIMRKSVVASDVVH